MSVSSSNELAFWAVSMVAAYKVVSLLIGFGFGYMGYRLFLAGIQRPAGELEASSGSMKLKMSRTAPGTFFALFGAAIITATVYQGFDVELPGAARKIINTLPERPPMVNNEPGN